MFLTITTITDFQGSVRLLPKHDSISMFVKLLVENRYADTQTQYKGTGVSGGTYLLKGMIKDTFRSKQITIKRFLLFV